MCERNREREGDYSNTMAIVLIIYFVFEKIQSHNVVTLRDTGVKVQIRGKQDYVLNVFKSRMAHRGLIRPTNPQGVKSLTTVLRNYTDISKCRIFYSCSVPLVRLSAAMFTMKTQRNVGVWGRRRGLKSKGSLEK